MKTESGSLVIDSLLEGGYDNEILTTVYGPAGTGKTTVGMMAAISVAKAGKKAIIIDTEGGFSSERFKQLSGNDRKILQNTLILKPINFKEQMKTLHNLCRKLPDNIGLIVIDTISMLYRVEVSSKKNVKEVNNELGLQISWLVEIARTKNIPVIVTNQVYADFENQNNVKMVGGDILRYSSKCLIELFNLNNKRRAVLIKHRSLPAKKEILFEIVESGFREAEI